KLKRDIPAVFLALCDRQTPVAAKVCAALTIAYALSPIDLIPDFIPVLGYLDDLILLPAMVALTLRLIPADKLEQCRQKSEGMWDNGMPKKWYFAIPIVLFWLIIVLVVLRSVLG
ncbi:MAG: YkvA family protein, partial [Oscillospiraceae bacterium]